MEINSLEATEPNKLIPNSESKLERKGNVATVLKPEATYSVVYGYHGLLGLVYMPIDPNSIPNNSNGVFFETQYNVPWVEEPYEELGEILAFPQNAGLVEKLKRNSTPIIFADTGLKRGGIALLQDTVALVGETVIGIKFLEKIAKQAKSEGITRRNFLKLGAAGLAGAWLGLPTATRAGRIISGTTGQGENTTATLRKASEKVHPEVETFTTLVRNVVLAHKEEAYAKLIGKKPHLTTVIGGLHVGLEEELQHTPKKRIDFLKKLQPVLKEIVDKESFYKIIKFGFDPQQDGWKINRTIELPELKELVV